LSPHIEFHTTVEVNAVGAHTDPISPVPDHQHGIARL